MGTDAARLAIFRLAIPWTITWVLLAVANGTGQAATYATANFEVYAPSAEFAKQVGEQAEIYRRDLAQAWLGKEFPNWSAKCPIRVRVGPRLPAAGVTRFNFDRGHVFGWDMEIQGTPEAILDSVLPHEVNHTIFATHFRRALPRWLDEGAATTVEADREKNKHQEMLVRFLRTGHGIAFNEMYSRMDYPADMLPLYAQGFSVTRYLIEQKGRTHFVRYVSAGLATNDWAAATREHYGYKNLGSLQVAWLDWVQQGSPLVVAKGEGSTKTPSVALVSQTRRARPTADLLYRVRRDAGHAPSVVPGPIDETKLVPVPKRVRDESSTSESRGSEWTKAANPVEGPASGTHEPAILMEWGREGDATAHDEAIVIGDARDVNEPILDASIPKSSRLY